MVCITLICPRGCGLKFSIVRTQSRKLVYTNSGMIRTMNQLAKYGCCSSAVRALTSVQLKNKPSRPYGGDDYEVPDISRVCHSLVQPLLAEATGALHAFRVASLATAAAATFFNKTLKNVSCEYDRLNG